MAVSLSGAELDKADFFESKIRPLLASRCFSCHGQSRTAGLRLDARDSAMRGGRSGRVIVPGKPEESILLRAVAHTHDTLKMPPTGKLEAQDIANIESWIRDGAVWPDSPREFFLGKIKPVLDAKCNGCHGQDPQGGLRLDTREGFARGGKSGAKGLPELLLQAVRYEHATLKMPPAGKLPAATIADLERWVKQGSQWSDAPESLAPYVIRADQKAFWSFQPVRLTVPPAVSNEAWNRNPIDRFIYSALDRKSLRPGAPADKATLIRRVTYDLTGLPPSPAEIDAFISDNSPGDYARLVDRLLASPRYGERWGRHWLDLVRYADTAGDASDYPVPEAYKYRNWVIDAFNEDKPYDRFVREQIAGDLLPSASDEERWRQTIATGYLAISRRIGVSPHQERHVTIEDTIDNTTKTFLGLGVGCARCHDHKFDPIPTSDYYALYGIFDSSTFPHAGAEHRPHRSDFVYRVGTAKAREILRPFEQEIAPWNKREREKFAEYQEFQNRKVTAAGRTREVAWSELLALREERRAIAEKFPPLETAYAISEGDPHDVPIQKMGEPRSPGAIAPRGFLQILGGQRLPQDEEGSGRLQLANWIASPDNPLTARVMVNRIWHFHFGPGLVPTTSDFGVRGTAPSNPALLNYLAARFMQDGWSVKAMHRLIVLSETYRLSSDGIAANIAADPQNDLHWRQNRRRLDAESISDTVRLIGGSLDLTPGERHPMPNERTYFYRQHEPFQEFYVNRKRTVYGLQQRFQKNAYLDLFDGPDGNLPLSERKSTTTSLQALWLMNSKFLHEESDAIAERLRTGAQTTPARVRWAYQNIFGRPAGERDVEKAREFMDELGREHRAAGCQGALCEQRVWAGYIRAMLSSNSFLFVD
ncbi:MAG: PSD1 and planctomycete cytochrome C domain-containing protein [Bryobacteraceae bacterium]